MPRACLSILLSVLAVSLLAPTLTARGEDPLERAATLKDLGFAQMEAGQATDSATRLRQAYGNLCTARDLFKKAAQQEHLPDGRKRRIERDLLEVEDGISMIEALLQNWGEDAPTPDELQAEAEGRPTPKEIRAPEPKEGERLGPWCTRVKKLYESTDAPEGRAALARQMAVRAKVLAVPHLLRFFASEKHGTARTGVHEALAIVGTSRVATPMGNFARRNKKAHWPHALDVIYRCLEKPEKDEPERPFQLAIRRFHKLKDRKLSKSILSHLDGMGDPGVAALGEVLYVENFGNHDDAIERLSFKRSSRAVPPLVHCMNRFKFDQGNKIPAHKALLKMGWFAVPELINRLNNKAAGIWISYTLRKISGETMGTHKRKWHDWWKTERKRHPEVMEQEEREGKAPAAAPVVTGD